MTSPVTPRDPYAHLRAKQAELEARHAPQLYLLCDEAEMRAIVRWRRGPAELRRQARAALQGWTEVPDE